MALPLDPPLGRSISQIAVTDENDLWVMCADGSVWVAGSVFAERPRWRLVVRGGRGPDPVAPDDPTPPRPSLGALQDALRADRTQAAQHELERQIEELRRRLASGE
jgi:hypothetical protein